MVEAAATDSQDASTEQQEQIKLVLSYLDKKETRNQALDIILAYTTTKDNRALFEDTDAIKLLLRLLPEADATLKVAQCLINFSVDPFYQIVLVHLNVAGRIFDFLKENVKMDMKANVSTHVAYDDKEQVYEIRNKTKKADAYEDIELCLMLLTNVSISEEGQKHLVGNLKTRGIILDNLFGMFCYFLKSNVFDFVANILSNVSALKEGREVIIDRSDMLPKIVDMLRYEKVSAHRRTHLLACLRNLAFEYEPQEQRFFDSKLINELAYILATEQGLTELPQEAAQFKANITKAEF